MKKVALTAWIAMWMVPWPVTVEAQESGMDTYDLPETVVSSSRYHGGIIGSTTAVGNMLGEKDTMDVPMNTKAVSKEAFTVFAMPGHELEDGMTVIPTVRRSTSALSVRGFYTPASMLQINGVPGMLDDLDVKTNFLERADVVSGPAIVYNGSSTAGRAGGGHISLQSKRAGQMPLTAVDMNYASDGNVTAGVDVGRRFGKTAAWGIRVNALNQGGTLARFGEKREARNLFINIDHYDKHSQTNLLLGYEYKKVSGKTLYFAPGKNLNALPVPPDGDTNMMPEWSYFQSTTKLATLSHEQRFDTHWTAFFHAGVKSYERPVSMSNRNTSLLADGAGNFTGRFRQDVMLSASKSLKYYLGAGMRFTYDFGMAQNELTVGVDTASVKNWSASSKKLATIVGNLYGQNRWASRRIAAHRFGYPRKLLLMESRRWIRCTCLMISCCSISGFTITNISPTPIKITGGARPPAITPLVLPTAWSTNLRRSWPFTRITPKPLTAAPSLGLRTPMPGNCWHPPK